MQSNNSTNNNIRHLYKKGEDHKKEEEGDQEGRAGTSFFASGRPTKAVFRQNSA